MKYPPEAARSDIEISTGFFLAQQFHLVQDVVGGDAVAARRIHAQDHALDARIVGHLPQDLHHAEGGDAAVGNVLARIAAGDFAVAGDVGDARPAGRIRPRGLGIAARADFLQIGLEVGVELRQHLVLENQPVHQAAIERALADERPLIDDAAHRARRQLAAIGDHLHQVSVVLIQNLVGDLQSFRTR